MPEEEEEEENEEASVLFLDSVECAIKRRGYLPKSERLSQWSFWRTANWGSWELSRYRGYAETTAQVSSESFLYCLAPTLVYNG